MSIAQQFLRDSTVLNEQLKLLSPELFDQKPAAGPSIREQVESLLDQAVAGFIQLNPAVLEAMGPGPGSDETSDEAPEEEEHILLLEELMAVHELAYDLCTLEPGQGPGELSIRSAAGEVLVLKPAECLALLASQLDSRRAAIEALLQEWAPAN